MRGFVRLSGLAAGLALLAATLAAPAWAIPIRNLQVTPSKPLLRFSARLMSPPNGSCQASAVAALFRAPVGRRQVRVRLTRRTRVNLCPAANAGVTYGTFRGTMRSATLPRGRYRFALVATASVAGKPDTDELNRIVFIR